MADVLQNSGGSAKSLDELIEQQKREDDLARRREKIAALHAGSGVPRRFAEAEFHGFERRTPTIAVALDTVVQFVVDFEQNVKAGRCLILAGPPGTGKTHLACAAVRALCSQGLRGHYVKLGDAIRRLRATWRDDAQERELDVLRYYRQADLLVIDEVGVQYGSEGEKVHAFDIIDGRYADMRPTIIVTNCRADELVAYLGERVVDRLMENGGRLLVLDGKSNRTRAR